MEVPKDKFILDACCGPRMMWYDKHHKNVIYIDKRNEIIETPGRWSGQVKIEPDMIADFRKMPFPDNSFKLVVMDPPHILTDKLTITLTKTYGGLCPDTWNEDIKKGIKEALRVLEPYGVLIFKWAETNVQFKDIEKVFPQKPLFYNIVSNGGKTSKKTQRTAWFCFMKIPKDVKP